MSDIYWIKNCPVPSGEDYHQGLEALLELMSQNGLKLYRTEQPGALGGPTGLIEKQDVVLIKVNAQWKYRGCTNSDVVRGLIRRVLDHPDGFEGEVVLFDNGQGQGSLAADAHGFGRYADDTVHANAEDESHSFTYLAEKVFPGRDVSTYLLDPIGEVFIDPEDHETDGYRRFREVSYPCFTTAQGTRIELKEGIWNGSGYSDHLKLINVPVLKYHNGCGITAALKSFCGVLSMADGHRESRHYDQLGRHMGEMIGLVRAPVLHILDCIWVSVVHHMGYPPENTIRLDQLAASIDPVGLDYWASKHILYPADPNEEHHPDRFPGLGNYLREAMETINAAGGMGGHQTTLGDSHLNVMSYSF